MIRILTLLLAFAIGAPAQAWADSDAPGGVSMVGASCCPVSADSGSQEQESQIVKACCCSPSPAGHNSTSPQLAPPTQYSSLAPVAAIEISSDVPVAEVPALVMSRAARAPPPPTLLAQHTSLVI